jgi:hypothetical protein
MLIIFSLWIYEFGLKFYNNIYNFKANCRAHILKTIFNNSASSIGVYGKDGVWTNIYDYETEDTLFLFLLFIRFKLGITRMRHNYNVLDNINKEFLENYKFSVITSYRDGEKRESILSYACAEGKSPTISKHTHTHIGYALLGDVDITKFVKAYLPSLCNINISVNDFIVILRNKHELDIKENGTLTIFNVDIMEEQTLKGDDIINI